MPIILDCKPLLNAWFPGSFPKLPCRADPTPPCPGFLTTQEAADHVRVHVDTLRRWVKLGVFPHIPLPGGGSDYRFRVAMIEEWARARALGMPVLTAAKKPREKTTGADPLMTLEKKGEPSSLGKRAKL